MALAYVLVLAHVLVSRPCHGANLIHDVRLCYKLMMFWCLVSDHVTLLGAFEICAAERNSNAIVALPLNLNARLALRKEAQCQGGGSQVLCANCTKGCCSRGQQSQHRIGSKLLGVDF